MQKRYQRRRVKARVESVRRLNANSPRFRQTGNNSSIKSAHDITRTPGRRRGEQAMARRGRRAQAQDERKNPLISTFDWTRRAAEISGFPRCGGTQERIEELARRMATNGPALVEEEHRGIGERRDRRPPRTTSSSSASPGVAAAARNCGIPTAAAPAAGTNRQRVSRRGKRARCSTLRPLRAPQVVAFSCQFSAIIAHVSPLRVLPAQTTSGFSLMR